MLDLGGKVSVISLMRVLASPSTLDSSLMTAPLQSNPGDTLLEVNGWPLFTWEATA